MKRVVVVPARGGSKRLPNKNKLLLGDRPLVCCTLDALVNNFEMIILSSDSEDILKLGEDYPSDSVTSQMRPSHLATDSATALQTVEYIFEKLTHETTHTNKVFDQIWLCLPTCPLRSKEDVINVQAMLSKDVDSVVSVTGFEFPPVLGLNRDSEGFITESDETRPFASGNTRSQDHKTIYRPNGAFYGAWWESFNKNRNFFKGRVKSYYMPKERSVDIDTYVDLKIARALLA